MQHLLIRISAYFHEKISGKMSRQFTYMKFFSIEYQKLVTLPFIAVSLPANRFFQNEKITSCLVVNQKNNRPL